MKEYHIETVRLNAGSMDAELSHAINRVVGADEWELHSIGEGVQTRIAGGGLTIDRLLVFERDAGPTLLLEEAPEPQTEAMGG